MKASLKHNASLAIMANTMEGNERAKRAEPSDERAQTTEESSRKKPRKMPLKWSEELHRDFVSAIFEFGVTNASPAVILKQMMTNDNEVTSERVKSHLQKYRVHRDRSKQQFMAEYDASLQRIKERGGTKWHPTDKFSSGDVAAAMVYYSMNPEAPLTMPFDMRRSSVAGSNNVPIVRSETAAPHGTSHDGAVHSDHQSGGPNLGISMMPTNPASRTALGSTGGPTKNVSEDGTSRGDGTTISMPNLTSEEYNSPLGTTLRYLTGLCNSMTDHLLEIRHASSPLAATNTAKSEGETICSAGAGSNTNPQAYPSQPPYDSSPGPYSHGSYPQLVHPGAPPIHPHGYMPPGRGGPSPANFPSYGYAPPYHHGHGHGHHGPPPLAPTSSYSYQQYPTSTIYPTRPTSTSNRHAYASTEPSNPGDKAIRSGPPINVDESNATPLFASSRVMGDSTSDYMHSGTDDRGRSASAQPPGVENTWNRSSPASSSRRSIHSNYKNSTTTTTNNNAQGNTTSPPSQQSWGFGHGESYYNNNYSNAHSFTYSYQHYHHDTHGGGSTGQGQYSNSDNVPQSDQASRHHKDQVSSEKDQKSHDSSPIDMVGSSKDLGDPWDEVPYSPIAH